MKAFLGIMIYGNCKIIILKALTLLLLLLFPDANAQNYKYCDIYQFEGIDSINACIASKKTFNELNKPILILYSDYKIDPHSSYSDGIYEYFYMDTFLIRTKSAEANGDSSKRIIFYNRKGQWIKAEDFGYYYKIKDEAEYNCTDPLTDEDFESERRWHFDRKITNKYDRFGRRIYSKIEHPANESWMKTRWKYDGAGRVIEKKDYHNNKQIHITNFKYAQNGYAQITHFYFLKRLFLKPDNLKFSASDSSFFETNESGKIISKQNFDNNKLVQKIEYLYDLNGNLSKTTVFDSSGKPLMTHLYKYY